MGDRTGKLKAAIACAAAVAGIGLAAAVASAQGPGDYEPPPTTTLPGPGPGSDTKVDFDASADAGPLKARVTVQVACEESCTARGGGKIRLTKVRRNGSTPFALGGDRASTDAGTATLKLKVPKLARRIVARDDFDGKARGKVNVTVSDAAGNVGSERLALQFQKRR